MKFFAILVTVTALAVASPVKRTVAQVETDLKDIATQVNNLDNSIKAFPDSGGSLSSALTIHTAAQKLVTSLNTANTDVKGTTGVTDSDGQTILDLVKNFEPTIIDSLNNIVTKKAAFDALPLGGVSSIVKQDLGQLSTATEALETSLISEAPASLKSQAQDIQSSVDAAFAKAQAAYA
ncbi:hydrophobic surface binding protein [Dendrothele bispora CBS 962.96]|uniref:Hydrophobic surface binding protein n=1 Tax=Dendrothele bispora (strain CBS 962.96) TaxID=1314807 RepID=A0A4V6T554_DENBC|nr:hydrophobic surface binding protein [Dendrothele bispora CBS 962.96]